jgi:NADH:ubiquinone oxidoreductase subunit F (NADH-binding)
MTQFDVLPDRATLPRLLPPDGMPQALAEHVAQFGPLPDRGGEELIGAVEAAGLTGRGGAAFPVARKLRAVTSQPGRSIVVANAAEGEPAAHKDKTLLAIAPHLVIDGITSAARAVDASHAVFYLHRDAVRLAAITAVLAERSAAGIDDIPITIVSAPHRFIAGEESAVVNGIEAGVSIPRVKPPRVFESGIDGRPTLVQNVESLAHIGLIGRFGPEWFRGVGTDEEPGTMLFTVSGAVREPRVIEAPIGVSISEIWTAAGGLTEPIQAVLFGGYHGSWLTAADTLDLRLGNAELRPRGSALGAGVVVALPVGVCGLAETARVLTYLAGESAGQCGPCLHGMPRLAESFTAAARPRHRLRGAPDVVTAAAMVTGRSACSHPDGSVRFAQSALRVFAPELDAHNRGRCTARSRREILPTPGQGFISR